MEYRNKARVTFHTNCCTTLPKRSLYICGTRGTLKGTQNLNVRPSHN
jgi:hypothetical protein